jgi:predicted esterase
VSVFLVLALSQLTPCPAGWEALDGDACLWRGKSPGAVVYFHGMLAPDPRAFTRELGFVEPAARKHGLTVIALKGVPGLCDWAAEYTTWWCWPTVKQRTDATTSIRARVTSALDDAATRLGQRLALPVLAGYSNGGYFTSILMDEGSALGASAFVVMHAGLVSGVNVPARPRPTLLIAAEGDRIQRPTMESFRDALTARAWSPAFVLRPKEHPLELEDFEHLARFVTRIRWRPAR